MFWNTSMLGIIALQIVALLTYIVGLEKRTTRLNLPKLIKCDEYISECHTLTEFGNFIGFALSSFFLVIVGWTGGNMVAFTWMVYIIVLGFTLSAIATFFWNRHYLPKFKALANTKDEPKENGKQLS
ncbi:MAG: hypothetical protein FWE45_05090 [Firmicutes bacterium]|nr:hypothetical protein [Bacillota bacterium]